MITRPDTENLATVGLLRAMTRAIKPSDVTPARPAIKLAA